MNEVTISKAEYDAMRETEIKHALLVDALFAHAKDSYNHKELTFYDVEDIMLLLYPETYAKRLREVNKENTDDSSD